MSSKAAADAEAQIRKTSKSVKATAESVKNSAANIEETSDRSTRLAADRTVFAAERTYAAWIRTGMAALASGVGARALLSRLVFDPLVMFAGTVLILFSAFCFCAAVWRELVPRLSDPVPRAVRIPRPVLFFINGSLTLVALAALVGIWLSHYRAAG
jgi:putative membrane protein